MMRPTECSYVPDHSLGVMAILLDVPRDRNWKPWSHSRGISGLEKGLQPWLFASYNPGRRTSSCRASQRPVVGSTRLPEFRGSRCGGLHT